MTTDDLTTGLEPSPMNRRTLLGGIAGLTGAAALTSLTPEPAWAVAAPPLADVAKAEPAAVVARYAHTKPTSWGENISGVLRRLPVVYTRVKGVRRPVAALTFDACGSPKKGSSGFDKQLIDVLKHCKVPATLFLSSKWIAANPRTAEQLVKDPLFAIGNHGTRHVPLSVTGRAMYGMRGTATAREAADEVWGNTLVLEELMGKRPRLFRTGTAYYDDVAVAICRSLGQLPIGYSSLTDFGATAPSRTVAKQLTGMKPGDVGLGHFNHPEKWTAEGLAIALPKMLKARWVFVRVPDVVHFP